jgi:hypothetical protein
MCNTMSAYQSGNLLERRSSTLSGPLGSIKSSHLFAKAELVVIFWQIEQASRFQGGQWHPKTARGKGPQSSVTQATTAPSPNRTDKQ